ncbi:acylpyruvate hydrolase [Geosmithia morbida]|uniref:Acylpyruvate hydrolase n=1 Tax=Geosmithia morbida TaxID=1094350 RepID=A0A9P4YVV2_9HYPO|nr:acylpyruvate hydrolase [Geosmithia morbida]KAF4123477.1 acylpyruvate hydrolase [Geosmithia morbida]
MATLSSASAQASSLKQAGKVVCIGRNYAAHITELNNTKPKQPFFFLKPTSSMVLPGEGPCLRPKGTDLHYEVELALVIGKLVRDLKADDTKGALDAIQVAIDMTARNAQDEAKKKGLPWSIAKGFDTFLPLSQVIPKSAIPDPHDAELFLNVNGETRQDGSTRLMIYQIPRILSDISKVMTLHPGDVVLTGTPEGVGSVVPGDVMRAGIRVRILYRPRLGGRVSHLPAGRARPLVDVGPEVVYGGLDLGAQVGAVEAGLVDDAAARRVGAVPAQAVDGAGRATLLEDDAHRVGEADGVVRRVGRQEEHVALADEDVAEFAVVDHLEHHDALVLVEPLGRLVDVVVCAGVGAADNLPTIHDSRAE